MDFYGRGGSGQGLRIGVNGGKTCAGKFTLVQGVAQTDARAADTKNFNRTRPGRFEGRNRNGSVRIFSFSFHKCDRIESLSWQQTVKHAPDSGYQRAAFAFAVFERAKFREADGGDKFRLVEGGFEAADGLRLALHDGHLQNVFREAGNMWDARTAAAKKNTRAQIIGQPGLFQVLGDELENLFQPQGHDLAQVLDVNDLKHHAQFVGDRHRLAFALRVQQRRTVLQFQFFGAAQGHFKTVSQIV